ncbi:MAG: response regulator [Bdellovibrionaceae bacterium]|nr:response regulator [Pseudobdellovibrionaceae bacterium]NUM58601.1 response regulator [Pseudobdellovibrionaceae bacterium]
MIKRKIIHIDDSMIVRKTVKNQLSSLDYVELISCDSFFQLQEILSIEETIDLIITDLNMPNNSGYEILEWIKTNPDYHFIPTIVLTAESSTEKQNLAKKRGASQVLIKPYLAQDLITAIQRHFAEINKKQLKEIDNSFIQNSLILIEEILDIFENKNDHLAEVVLQKLHQLKGDALSSQWPIIAYFIHDFEDVWKFCLKNQSINNKQLFDVTIDGIVTVHRMLLDLKIKKSHRLPQNDFYNEFIQIKKNVEKGWINNLSLKKTISSSHESTSNKENTEIDSNQKVKSILENSDFIRMQRNKLDELYSQVKKISQIKTRMNIFISRLKNEMSDEPFIEELAQMNQELARESQSLTEFFLLMRTKELRYLLETFKATTKKTAELLGKTVETIISADENIPIDTIVLSKMEAILGHLIRNSLDHGIETDSVRSEKGKVRNGTISLDVSLKKQMIQTDDMLQFKLKDDGSGIDIEKIKNKVKKLGLMSEEQLKDLPDKSVIMMIFLDSISTKEEVSIVSGRGVGMSFIKKEVENLQGTVSVETGPWGTCFEILVPRYYKL